MKHKSTQEEMVEHIRQELKSGYERHIQELEREVERLKIFELIYDKLTISANLDKNA